MARKTVESTRELVIPSPDIREVVFTIEGTSPLLCHSWNAKILKEIADKQAGAPKSRKKEPKVPQAEYEASLYKHPDGGYGFPAASFRLAAISACRGIDGLTMTQARGLFVCPQDLVKIEGSEPRMDVRPVRIQGTTADIRYRGIFWPWWCRVIVRYNAGATSLEQIANLLMLAGATVGIGEWRAERGGNYGLFVVGSEAQVKRNGSKAKREAVEV